MQLLDCINHNAIERESKASPFIEKCIVPCMLVHFFATGKVAGKQSFDGCTDEEYISALTDFAQELARYAVNRACANDASSVELARRVVIEINTALLKLDFRNGPLRRKYDGVKYAVKSIEETAFELSLASANSAADLFTDLPPVKRSRTEPAAGDEKSEPAQRTEEALLDWKEWEEIHERTKQLDACRELISKECRDVLKASKQAIFSLHRGASQDAERMLLTAKKKAVELLSLTKSYPVLRAGMLSSALEEWCEGAMLLQWVKNQRIPSLAELEVLNSTEYLGGLSDLTGEVGRMAVALGTKRDLERVQQIRELCMVAVQFIGQAQHTFGRPNSKLTAALANLKKIEDIVYGLLLGARRITSQGPPDESTERQQDTD